MEIKRVIIAIIVFGFLVFWSCFAVYGMVQFYEKPMRTKILESWKERTIDLELEIEEYERITKALPVLRQLITPLCWLQIEALAEKDRQEKQKGTADVR